MIIDKVLNNNVVIVKDINNVEKVIMGRGLAFKKKVGDAIEADRIEKVFSLSDPDASNKFQEIVKDIPLEYLEVAEEIITYGKTQLGKPLSDLLFVSLVDHIFTSIQRYLEGIYVRNALLWEIKRFYPDEYKIGKKALEIINQTFKVQLSEDEAGFIGLHFANAEMDEAALHNMYDITKIMQQITNIVKYKFQMEFDENSVYYYRFITHLKFFAKRLVSGKTYQNEDDMDLLDMVKVRYKNSYQCVNEITNFIYQKYQYVLSNEEKLYLTIHIERLVYKSKED